MKTRLMLMHTMNGEPATYVPGGQIVFVDRSKKFPAQLCRSIREIQQQRRMSRQWRRKNRLGMEQWKMGFIYVEVPR